MKHLNLLVILAVCFIALFMVSMRITFQATGASLLTVPATSCALDTTHRRAYIECQLNWQAANCLSFIGGVCPIEQLGQVQRIYVKAEDVQKFSDLLSDNTRYEVVLKKSRGNRLRPSHLLLNGHDFVGR